MKPSISATDFSLSEANRSNSWPVLLQSTSPKPASSSLMRKNIGPMPQPELVYLSIYTLWIETLPEKIQITPQIIPQTLPKKVLGSIGIYIYIYLSVCVPWWLGHFWTVNVWTEVYKKTSTHGASWCMWTCHHREAETEPSSASVLLRSHLKKLVWHFLRRVYSPPLYHPKKPALYHKCSSIIAHIYIYIIYMYTYHLVGGVNPSLKKWVRQLGLLFPTKWTVLKVMFQTSNQYT